MSLDCKAGQGYFFARPIDRDSVREMLEVSNYHADWMRILRERQHLALDKAS